MSRYLRLAQYLLQKFNKVKDKHMGTRSHKTAFEIPKHVTETYAKSFVVQGCKIYNDNYEIYANSSTLSQFITQWKKILKGAQ